MIMSWKCGYFLLKRIWCMKWIVVKFENWWIIVYIFWVCWKKCLAVLLIGWVGRLFGFICNGIWRWWCRILLCWRMYRLCLMLVVINLAGKCLKFCIFVYFENSYVWVILLFLLESIVLFVLMKWWANSMFCLC